SSSPICAVWCCGRSIRHRRTATSRPTARESSTSPTTCCSWRTRPSATWARGPVDPLPRVEGAMAVLGYYLTDACRYYEFRVTAVDDRSERVTMEAEVVHYDRLRAFVGFNRARHAVVEAAILATRTSFLPLDDVAAEFRK